MNQTIFLPNYNLSLLQSQKHFSSKQLKTNKINISTEIIPSQESNSFEIKLVVDSPFGQLQISNNIFINQKEQSSANTQLKKSLEVTNQVSKESIDLALQEFLQIYSKDNKKTLIRNNQSSDIVGLIEDQDIEDEDKSKSTAPNSPNQQNFSNSTNSSPTSTETALDEFQVENTHTEFHDIEGNNCQDSSKTDTCRSNSQTINEQSMSNTSLIMEEDSEMANDTNGVSLIFMKSEKKNSVKNVLKAFGNFITNMKEGQDDEIIELSCFKSVDDLKKRYQRYSKLQSYNNSLVCKIIQHQQYGIIFEHFINNYATSWLQRSDVGDKPSHETFISFCKSACEDHELLSCLKIIKKKHLKLSSC